MQLAAPVEAQTESAGPAVEPVVSLDELLAHAGNHAPTLILALRRARYADADHAEAERIFRENPAVDLEVGPRWEGRARSGFDFAVGLQQPIEIAGQGSLRRTAASRSEDQLRAEVSARRWEIRREVILAYYAAVVERAREEVAETALSFAEETLAVAQRRDAAGDASAIDVRVAEIDVARAQQVRIRAAQGSRAARLDLAEVTGWSLERPPRVEAVLGSPRPVPALEGLLQRMSKRHPALRSERARVVLARSRAAVADREAWPTPTLGVRIAREASLDGPSTTAQGTLGFPLPLWDRHREERLRRRLDVEVAQMEESQMALRLRVQVIRFHGELATATEQLTLARSSIAQELEDNLALLRRGFDAGELDLFVVVAAKERFLAARNDLLGAYSAYYGALAELEFAVGAPLLGRTVDLRGSP